MAATESQKKAIKKYQEAHKEEIKAYQKEYMSQFCNLRLRMTEEQRAIIKAQADAEGKSMNQFILERATMKL